MAMVIYVGSDHAGYPLKEKIKKILDKKRYDIKDMGTDKADVSVDYPDYAAKVAKSVAKNKATLGILICGTGIGVCIAANKVKGARAALAYNALSAELAREHNNANILCVGARTMDHRTALNIVKTWLSSSFTNEARHTRRIREISKLEK